MTSVYVSLVVCIQAYLENGLHRREISMWEGPWWHWTGRGENVLNRFTGSSIGIQGVLGVPRALALFRGGTRWVVGGASG